MGVKVKNKIKILETLTTILDKTEILKALKPKFTQYPAIHTNLYSLSNCTNLQYNHNI